MRIIIIRKVKIVTNVKPLVSPLNLPPITIDVIEPQQNVPINSATLMGLRNQLTIQHQGEQYILRQTRAGKLILTK